MIIYFLIHDFGNTIYHNHPLPPYIFCRYYLNCFIFLFLKYAENLRIFLFILALNFYHSYFRRHKGNLIISIIRGGYFVVKGYFFLLAVFIVCADLSAQMTVYKKTPDWESKESNDVSTGVSVADINNDGWDDIIISNGNDISRQNLHVYYNNKNGTFPTASSWKSGDIDYLGHCVAGDVNADGFIDVAACTFIGSGGMSTKGYVKLYMNKNGALETNPSFKGSDQVFTFSCALGDADGDGDVDLAIACGNKYQNNKDYGRIYYNTNGVFETSPGWKSSITMGAMDCEFVDIDKNGYLDLVFSADQGPSCIYLADNQGKISTEPSWKSSDETYFANCLSFGFIDNNLYPDLVIADNNQGGGPGKLKAYLFSAPPTGQSAPVWQSSAAAQNSCSWTEDIDGDSVPDLIAGKWFGTIDIYKGMKGSCFSTATTWSTSTKSVAEGLVLRDIDQKNRITTTEKITITTPTAHAVTLSKTNIERILSVKVNDKQLTPGTEYCISPNNTSGPFWISTKEQLKTNDNVTVEYIISYHRDLIVSNWDKAIGNYIFYNQTPTPVTVAMREQPTAECSVYTFGGMWKFTGTARRNTNVAIQIYSMSGRLIKNLSAAAGIQGNYICTWDGSDNTGLAPPSGLYVYRIKTNDKLYTGKISITGK